jgi:tetraacyldisaccharide 4'-kinase
VLLSRADEVLAERLDRLEALLGRERTLRLAHCVQGFVALDGARRPTPSRPFLLSGIARPERFHLAARGQAPAVAGTAVFPDHHPFTPAEIAVVLERARLAGADAVVTTAKDAVRLPAVTSALPFLVLRIAAVIADEARLRDRVLAVARRVSPLPSSEGEG